MVLSSPFRHLSAAFCSTMGHILIFALHCHGCNLNIIIEFLYLFQGFSLSIWPQHAWMLPSFWTHCINCSGHHRLFKDLAYLSVHICLIVWNSHKELTSQSSNARYPGNRWSQKNLFTIGPSLYSHWNSRDYCGIQPHALRATGCFLTRISLWLHIRQPDNATARLIRLTLLHSCCNAWNERFLMCPGLGWEQHFSGEILCIRKYVDFEYRIYASMLCPHATKTSTGFGFF